jgi:predicted metal-dependent enzyme (double-stranded beta helix superfamily)
MLAGVVTRRPRVPSPRPAASGGGGGRVPQSAAVITVLLRYDHHIDHTFLEATHSGPGRRAHRHRGQEEVARFPVGSWDGVYRYARNRVREPDGSERTAKGLEVELGDGADPATDRLLAVSGRRRARRSTLGRMDMQPRSAAR